MHVVVAEFLDLEGLAPLERAHAVHYDPELGEDRARLLPALAEARALIVRNRTRVDAQLLDAAPSLQVVGRLGVGLDNLDLAELERRGITLVTARGLNARSAAEYVLGALFTAFRPVMGATEAVLQGQWPRQAFCEGRELMGLRLGILGLGAVGGEVARLATALGLEVSATDPYLPSEAPAWAWARSVDLETLLRTSEVLTLHVPATERTLGLLDRARLASLPRGGVLIHTSRGGIVDEAALVDLLREGHLAGAVLDVFAREPLPAGAFPPDLPNLVLTPHIAGLTRESNRRVSLHVASGVAEALERRA